MGEMIWGLENKDRYPIFNKVKKGVLLERQELKGMFISDNDKNYHCSGLGECDWIAS